MSKEKHGFLTNLKNQKGMSLIEIILAIGIVAGVGSYVLSKVFESAEKADIKQAQAQINDIVANVKYYKREKKKYPQGSEGLQALVDEGVMEEIPEDPWGNEYYYEAPGSRSGKKFEVWSSGPDEDSDTEDDVVSWKTDDDE